MVSISAIRTGGQYLASLDDDRNVWLNGSRVRQVGVHPPLADTARVIANLFDLQHGSEHAGILTRDGAHCAYHQPVSAECLVQRRAAFQTFAGETLGLMGRTPDFMSTMMSAFAVAADAFSAGSDENFGKNVTSYYQRCRENDIFLAHASINPPSDRRQPASGGVNRSTHLHVTGESGSGIRVTGAKLISTLAPLANELVVFPLPGYTAADRDYAIAFAVPVDTPGLTLVCRESPAAVLAHPLHRYDEIDATVLFDDVLVPWDRVFYYGDPLAANELYDVTTARHQTGHHGLVRAATKIDLMVGVALELAESSGSSAKLHIQEMLGEAIGYSELAWGCVHRAENESVKSEWGTIVPSMKALMAGRYHMPRWCQRMVEIIQIIGGGSLLAASPAAAGGGPNSDRIRELFPNNRDGSWIDRNALLTLAWDISGDSFGQRQLQFERYHAGDPVRLAAGQYMSADTTQYRALTAYALGAWGEDRNEHSLTDSALV